MYYYDRLINWHYERCGSVEPIFKVLKADLAGESFPCGEFGANAAWWRLQCLFYNIIRALQLHVFPKEYKRSRLKKLRFRLFCISARVIKTGRQLILKLLDRHPSFDFYKSSRYAIGSLRF